MSAAAGSDQQPQQDQPPISEQDVQDYVKQLRSAPAEQIVTEMIFTVLNAAQVKLGRRDARLLIDLSAVMVDHVREHVSEELTKQVDQALGQLRLSQVSAENAAANKGESEPNDLARVPTPVSPAPSPSAPASPASKLWVPGK